MLTVEVPRKTTAVGIDIVSSYWNAAFNPIVFQFTRQDSQIVSITQATSGKAFVTLNGTTFGTPSPLGKYVYLNSEPYEGTYLVTGYAISATQTFITIDTPYLTNTTGGYINNLARLNYRINFALSVYKSGSYPVATIYFNQSVTQNGYTALDIAPPLKNYLTAVCDQTSTNVNAPDNNLFGFTQLGFTEVWDGSNEDSGAVDSRFYFMYSALQLRNPYGSNMFSYVPLLGSSTTGLTVPDTAKKGKFLTKFTSPKYWNGYPFRLMFIYDAYLNGQQVYREEYRKDINGLAINDTQTQLTTTGEEAVNYLNITGNYASNIEQVDVYLSILNTQEVTTGVTVNPVLNPPVRPVQNFNGNITVTGIVQPKPNINKYYQAGYVTNGYATEPTTNSNNLQIIETLPVDVIHDCVEEPFYLMWLNTIGGFDFYMFSYSQTYAIDTGNEQQFSPYEWDISVAERNKYDLQNTNQDVYVLGAERVTKADLDGLVDLFASPIVYKVDADGTQTRVLINKGSLNVYQTDKASNRIEFELLMPETQLQLG